MRALPWLGVALAFAASVFLFRIVHHGYTDHGHLDVLHLAFGLASVVLGAFALRRALTARG